MVIRNIADVLWSTEELGIWNWLVVTFILGIIGSVFIIMDSLEPAPASPELIGPVALLFSSTFLLMHIVAFIFYPFKRSESD